MAEYRFRAPTLFDADATAEGSGTGYHNAPATGEMLAKTKPCADWLKRQLRARGLNVQGPETDEGGWTLTAPAKDGFVLMILGVQMTAQDPFHLIVTRIGGADIETRSVSQLIGEMLNNADITSDVVIED